MKALWNKYKEYVLYLVFGGVTTVVNYGVYVICGHVLHLGVVPSNIIAWVFAVVVAFVTNKLWVFESKSHETKTVAKEFVEFVLARLLTMLIETLLLWIFVDLLHVNDLIMKIITNVIVVVLNYIFSRFFIFKKTKEPQPETGEKVDSESENRYETAGKD